MKIEVTTQRTFYRITSGWWGFRFWKYYKRKEAKGKSWLIWCVNLGCFDIECYALHNKPIEGNSILDLTS